MYYGGMGYNTAVVNETVAVGGVRPYYNAPIVAPVGGYGYGNGYMAGQAAGAEAACCACCCL